MAEYLQNSFISGEISEKLLGRTDTEAYFRAAKKIHNMMVSLEGGVISRPGFQYLADIDSGGTGTPRCFEYVYSHEQAFVVVMQDDKLWVFDPDGNCVFGDGGESNPGEDTPYDNASVWSLKYAQNGRFMYFADGDIKTYVPPAGGNDAIPVNNKVHKLSLSGDGTTWSFAAVTFATPSGYSMGLSVTPVAIGGTGFTKNIKYKLAAFNSRTGVVSKLTTVVSTTEPPAPVSDNYRQLKIEFVATEGKTAEQNKQLFLEQHDSFFIYKEYTSGKDDYYRIEGGYIKVSDGVGGLCYFNDIALGKTDEYYIQDFDDFDDERGYPMTLSFMQDRLVAASTPYFPLNIYLSAAGAYEDLTYKFTSGNGRGVMLTMATREKNDIKFIEEIGRTILMTDGDIHRFGTTNDSAISYTNIPGLKKQYNFGVCDIKPVVVGNRLIFINRSMKEIRDLVYNYQTDSFDGNELSYFVPQLIGKENITDSIYQHHPYRVLWYTRADGVLLGMTYSTALKTFAWHRHELGGGAKFRSVTSIPFNRNDVLFAIAQLGDKYYLTRMCPTIYDTDDITRSYYLDLCKIVEEEVAFNKVDGLDHLEGLEVGIVADGGYLGKKIVEGGVVELGDEYNKVIVGLEYDSELETIDLNIPNKNIMFRNKNIHTVHVKTEKSRTYEIGQYGNNLTYDYYGVAPEYTIGDEATNKIRVSNSWGKPANISIKRVDPLPLNITCLEFEFEVGGK